jgi:hypothetical protein
MSEPPTPPPPTLREARAAIFAALCVLVAALGHGAFSAGGIPAWALGTATVALFLGARLFTRRERGFTAILAAMALIQVGLHFFFEDAQRNMAAASATGSMSSMAGMPARGRMWCGSKEPDLTPTLLHIGAIHPAGTVDPTAAHAVAGITGMAGMTGSMTTGMLAVHALAALVAAWWLRRGEAATWNAARSAVLFLVAPLLLFFATVPPTMRPSRTVVAAEGPRLGPGLLLRHFVTRRGPPVAVATFC